MKRIKILVVEDTDLVREALLEHLANMFPRWELLGVPSVYAAVRALETFEPDVVLLDYVLADGTAEDLLEHITAPVVLATGYVGRSMFEALNRRYDNRLIFLPKPYSKEELREALTKALNR